jgi:hypothetical protein
MQVNSFGDLKSSRNFVFEDQLYSEVQFSFIKDKNKFINSTKKLLRTHKMNSILSLNHNI